MRFPARPLLLSLALLPLAGAGRPPQKAYLYTYYDRNGNIVINNLPPSYVQNQGLTLRHVGEGTVRPALTRQEFKQVLRSPAIIAMVDETATRHGVDPYLARAIIMAESAFITGARSHAGALGLMQLMPKTAERFGVTNPFDPQQNITGGVKYLKWLHDYFKGDLTKVIAAYNAGERNVEKHNGIPPFAETRAYVPRVMKLFTGRLVQPDARAAGSEALLKKGRGGFLVREKPLETRTLASNAPQASAATPVSGRMADPVNQRVYLWKDRNGTFNLTDTPPPPGIPEIKVDR